MATNTTHYGFTKPGVNDYVDISILNANYDNLDNVIYNNLISALADLAPEYDATATYSVGDYVTYNKTLYKCTTAIATAEAFDGTKWTAVKVGGELKSYDTRISTLEAGVDLEKSATNSFDDGIDSYFKKVVSSIVPVQAGSGTPSPSNVRAISGFTECVVKDFGKNFAPTLQKSVPNTTTNEPYAVELPVGTYTISAKVSTDGQFESCRVSFRKGTTQIAVGFIEVSSERKNATVTLTEECNRIYFYGGNTTSDRANTTYTDIQIERGSTATDYTPYVSPNTATISFGSAGTVYGGYVDLISGKLVVDKAMIDLGSLSWTYNTALLYFYAEDSNFEQVQVVGRKPNWMCSNYKIVGAVINADWGNVEDKAISTRPTTSYICVKDNDYTDATTFKTAMNGVQLVYELATPQEYQLTPTQLRSLVGANRLTSSTGEVTEVEYIKNKTIAWLLDLIRA